MTRSWFDQVSEDHRRTLAAISELETATDAAFDDEAEGWEEPLRKATASFLAFYEANIVPHMEYEEEHVYPALKTHLLPEHATVEPIYADHGALRDIVHLLEEDLANDCDCGGLAVRAKDLVLVLRAHIAREDGALFPVLDYFMKSRA